MLASINPPNQWAELVKKSGALPLDLPSSMTDRED
jgi:hypothetical protein